MEKKEKPDWITDEQWAANPNVKHWEQSRDNIKSIEEMWKLPKEAHEEICAHQRKMYEDAGLSTKHLDELYSSQKKNSEIENK
jgi:hypothetical protein